MNISEIDLLIALIICMTFVFVCFSGLVHEIDKRFRKLEKEDGKKPEYEVRK